MTSKIGKKSVPRSTKELSKEELLEILNKKRECNTRALRIVEELCEPSVQEDSFLSNLVHINQSHFDDIVTERSIILLCGYPLCSNPLGLVPKQQYKISLKQTTVYDLTDRKKYCSNSCFKAGVFVKNQMLTSPLWFRHKESIPVFKLLPSKSNKATCATLMAAVDEQCENKESVPFPTVPDGPDYNAESSEREERGREEPEKAVKSLPLESSSLKVEPEETSVEKVEKAVDEWINVKTLIYLLGEDAVKEKLKDNEIIFKEISDKTTSITPSHQKFDDLMKVFALLNLGSNESDRELQPLPDYSALKSETEDLNIKVRAYFSGQYVMDSKKVRKQAGDGEEAAEAPYELPLVDSHAQNALRRRVLLDRLSRVVPDVCLSLDSNPLIQLSDISSLVKTFTLSAHNVTFKPREWYLIALIFIKLLSLKMAPLHSCLLLQENKKRLILLLLSYNLPADYLENLVEWLTDPEHLVQKLRC